MTPATPTDAEIIQQVLDGDVEAFGVLVDRYQDDFAAYAKYMTGSADEAADIVQDSLVRAFRSLSRCRERTSFKSWLFRIVSNQCKTHLHRRRRHMEIVSETEYETLAADDAAARTEAEDLRRQIHAALQELPPDQREALVLRYVEGLGVQEIAKLVGAGISAVKMRLSRARDALRVRFEGVAI